MTFINRKGREGFAKSANQNYHFAFLAKNLAFLAVNFSDKRTRKESEINGIIAVNDIIFVKESFTFKYFLTLKFKK